MPPRITPRNKGFYLADWLRQYRMIHGMTQDELAKKTGVATYSVKYYEAGHLPRGAVVLVKLMRGMGLSVDTVLEPLDSDSMRHVDGDRFSNMATRSHAIAERKGWWVDYDEAPLRYKPHVLAAKIGLITSEVSEAMEAARESHYAQHTVDGKPEGVVVELADAIIRIFDFCEKLGLDLKGALLAKLDFNETRPVKHGKVF